jgi:hypothetical protein
VEEVEEDRIYILWPWRLAGVAEWREEVGSAASLATMGGGRRGLAFGRVEKKANRIEKMN